MNDQHYLMMRGLLIVAKATLDRRAPAAYCRNMVIAFRDSLDETDDARQTIENWLKAKPDYLAMIDWLKVFIGAFDDEYSSHDCYRDNLDDDDEAFDVG